MFSSVSISTPRNFSWLLLVIPMPFRFYLARSLLSIDIYQNEEPNDSDKATLRKIPQLHLIPWNEKFVERHRFCIVSGDSSETLRNVCLSTKFLRQEVR